MVIRGSMIYIYIYIYIYTHIVYTMICVYIYISCLKPFLPLKTTNNQNKMSLCFQCPCWSVLRVLSEVLLFCPVLLKNLCLQLNALLSIGNKTTDWKYMALIRVKSLWKDRLRYSTTELKASLSSIWEETSQSNSTIFSIPMQENTSATT